MYVQRNAKGARQEHVIAETASVKPVSREKFQGKNTDIYTEYNKLEKSEMDKSDVDKSGIDKSDMEKSDMESLYAEFIQLENILIEMSVPENKIPDIKNVEREAIGILENKNQKDQDNKSEADVHGN